ncbi:hypothetical protein LWI29_030648 [Acer saccharum]|uniref:CCHC-type domain-containing protein n=1 Tax=Acer saccharum TaxID=4024 RepID=A0AA39SRT6_ACESA|nr:hypothetical protein LWI29_030648 [Acer saccharum]
MIVLWDQLTMTEPEWTKKHDEYQALRERIKLVQFLLALTNDFEALRSSILHRKPLPTTDDILLELLAEQTRKGMSATPPFDIALMVSSKGSGVFGSSSSSKSTGKKPFCVFCRKPGHWKQDCLHLQRRNNANSSRAAAVESTSDIHSRVVAAEDISSSFTAEEVQLIRKVLMNPGNSHLAASIISGTSRHSLWFLDSRASNHMTFSPTYFSHSYPVKNSFPIYTANNTPLLVTNIGSVHTSSLTLPNVLLVPELTMNLISISQLCDQGYHVKFSASGCVVQDHRTGKLCGKGCRIGRLYCIESLHLPVPLCVVASVTSSIWHTRLGHLSFDRYGIEQKGYRCYDPEAKRICISRNVIF